MNDDENDSLLRKTAFRFGKQPIRSGSARPAPGPPIDLLRVPDWLRTLAGMAKRRHPREPTFRCGGGCRDTGWVEKSPTGRGTYARCEVCHELGPVADSKPRRRSFGG